MKVTVGKARVSEQELRRMSASEVKRRAAKAEGKPAPPPTPEEIEHNTAKARLEKLKAQRGNIVEKVEVEGEVFHIRKLNYEQLVELGLMVQRDGHNVLALQGEAGVCSFTIATLMQAIVNEDGTPYFTRDVMDEYMQEPGATGLLGELFLKANEVNPDILRTLKKS